MADQGSEVPVPSVFPNEETAVGDVGGSHGAGGGGGGTGGGGGGGGVGGVGGRGGGGGAEGKGESVADGEVGSSYQREKRSPPHSDVGGDAQSSPRLSSPRSGYSSGSPRERTVSDMRSDEDEHSGEEEGGGVKHPRELMLLAHGGAIGGWGHVSRTASTEEEEVLKEEEVGFQWGVLPGIYGV
jgi:hypothetical protein